MGLGPREILGPLGPWGLGPGLGPSVGSVGPAWGPQLAAWAQAQPGALSWCHGPGLPAWGLQLAAWAWARPEALGPDPLRPQFG